MMQNYGLQLRTLARVAQSITELELEVDALSMRHLLELSRINAQTHRLASGTAGALNDRLSRN